MSTQTVFAALATFAGGILLFSMARTEQSKEQLILIGGVALALTFGFLRKGSSGGDG